MEEQRSWICSRCQEMIASQFDSCWKCGTAKEGPPANEAFHEAFAEAALPEADERLPCPLCGGVRFWWGLLGGHPLTDLEDSGITRDAGKLAARRCDSCGNIQLFDSGFLPTL